MASKILRLRHEAAGKYNLLEAFARVAVLPYGFGVGRAGTRVALETRLREFGDSEEEIAGCLSIFDKTAKVLDERWEDALGGNASEVMARNWAELMPDLEYLVSIL